jgi:hypothetical protein
VNDTQVEALCVRLLCIQQINLHRVPQIMAMFQDMVDGNADGNADGVNHVGNVSSHVVTSSRDIEMHHMSKRGDEDEEELEEKDNSKDGDASKGRPAAAMVDLQTEMEWNVDIMSGDALHSALYVYKKHFEEGQSQFVETMKEQDSALRSLVQQILDIERQINDTYEYFSGEPIEHLPWSTEEGRLHYEEMQRIKSEKMERESKSNALDEDPLMDEEDDEEDDDDDEEEDDDDDVDQQND